MFAATPPGKSSPFFCLRFALPLFFALILAAIMAMLPTVAYAGDIAVDGTTCTLPDAISAANTNATVGGCAISGTPGTETLLLSASTYLLTVNGAYAADGPNATPSVTTNIVVSSTVEGGSIVERTGANSRLFHIAAAGNLTLRGITVQYGQLGSSGASDYGPAIYNRGTVTLFDSKLLSNKGHRGAGLYNTGTARLTNVEVYNNVATQHGGGIYNNNNAKTVTMTNTQVISNSAVSNGGGIFNNTTGSTITLSNTQVLENSAGNGAGLLNSTNSFINIINSEIRNNIAITNGGALQNNGGTVNLTHVEVTNNTATDGGGLYNSNTATMTVTSSQVLTNNAGSNGGGIFNGKTVTVVDSNVSGNDADGDGGGLYNTAGTSTIRNTDFVGNSASDGGAIASNINGTKVHLVDSEVRQNSASGDGGGLYINTGGSSAAITSTLFLTNSAGGDGGGVAIQTGSSAILTDTQIQNNSASKGGGIYANNNTTLNVTNSEIVQNTSSNQGGGIYSLYTVTASHTDFFTNTAGREGGGLYAGFDGSVILSNADFVGNNGGGHGGGFFKGNSATVTDSDFLNNQSSGGGGAIYSYSSSPALLLTNANVNYNQASGSGGGIYLESQSSVLTNVNLRFNSAGGNGGGLSAQYASSYTFSGSEIIGNTAGQNGGGIFSQASGSLTISGTQFMSNTATSGRGGAIYAFNSANLTNSPFRNNHAGNDGGVIYMEVGGVSLTNSNVIFSSSGGKGGAIYAPQGITLNSSDLISSTAASDGGALYSEFGGINLTDSDVIFNTSGGVGGGIYSFYGATLTNSDLISNTAVGDGGGVYAHYNIHVSNAEVVSNTSLSGDGGALYNVYSSYSIVLNNSPIRLNWAGGSGGAIYSAGTSNLTNSDVLSNTAGGDGGGIYGNNSVSLNNSALISNTAGGSGGGLYSDSSTNLVNSNVIRNSAGGRGGGIYNSGNNTVDVDNSDFIANAAIGDGGGLYINVESTASIDDSDFLTNTTSARGGGLFVNRDSHAILTTSEIRANTAQETGGGILNSRGIITVSNSALLNNYASVSGGGFFQTSGQSSLTDMRLINNDAGETGGAAMVVAGTGTINDSCIVNNQYISVNYLGNGTIDATNNWWGAASGPGGVALGAGDSITNSVTFAPFEVAPILGCPTLTADVDFAKFASPSSDLLPGQPLTFTLVVTNNQAMTGVNNLHAVDFTPAEFVLLKVDDFLVPQGNGYRIPYMDGGEVATLHLSGVVTRTLITDTVLTNSATISGYLTSLMTDTTSVNVTLPRIRWSPLSYTTGEESGILTATVTLSPTNPYTIATAQVGIPNPTTSAITFTTGSGSQDVGVTIPNDSVVFTRTILLNLLSSIGAVVDGAGDEAIIFILEDDAAPAIEVSKVANFAEAWVGDTITYTYRITNTGNVTLSTLTALDDALGAVTGLAGQLDPAATRSATLTYTVLGGDWPGPVVNHVVITGTNLFTDALASQNASASVALTTPALSFGKQASPAGNLMPGQPLTYTLTITNDDGRDIPNLTITDTLPSGFVLSQVITTGASVSLSGGNYVIASLPAAQVATLSFVGAVNSTLTNDLVLANTATLTQPLAGLFTATTSSSVVVPVVTWSSSSYTATEDSGSYTATLLLTPVNPYATVKAGVVITDSSPVTQLVTFPANSGSQPVVVTFTNDGVLLPRQIFLHAHPATGAAINGPFASITLQDVDAAPALVVTKSANVTEAWVGDPITYTYRITNTGNVTFTTIVASDNQLGTVAGLAGQLNPGDTRTATLSTVVESSDLPGPLVNTLYVTATDIFATDATEEASASVALAEPVLSFTKQVDPIGDLLPGQPVTYTLTLTNEDTRDIDDLFVTDSLPAGFELSDTNTSGPAITFNGSSYVIEKLLPAQVATIEFVGAVDATVSNNFALQNTATVSHSLFGPLSESVSNNVNVPTVTWSEGNYEADEGSGTFTATLLLTPANPYASVTVNVIVTDNAPAALQAAEVIVITFPPGSTSQPVVVSFVEDGVVVPRSITLQLQSPSGAALGGGAGGSLSAIELVEENDAPALVLTASVSPVQASVGDTITYTYRITNTGNVTFSTIAATDEQVGVVAGLGGQLNPGDSRTALVPYTVQDNDLPGPLVNTVTITGTDIFQTNITQSAITTVALDDPTALPETEQPQQLPVQLFLPSTGKE